MTSTNDSGGAPANASGNGQTGGRSRQMRRWAPVGAIVVVIAVVVGVLALSGGDDSDDTATDTSGPAGTGDTPTDLVPGEDAVSFTQAEDLGIVDEVDWGERCDTEIGTLAYPDYYAGECYAPFTGDNGGATAQGVTADTIKIVYFIDKDDDPILDYITGPLDYDDTTADAEDTLRHFLEMYETYFETYGRRVDLEFFVNESGTEDAVSARSQAARIAEEIKPFMVWGSPFLASDAFGEELAARGIYWLSLAGVEPALAKRYDPYILGVAKDADQNRVLGAEFIGKQLAGRNAVNSGDFQDQERRFAYLYIETSDASNRTAELFRDQLRDEYGVELADMIPFTLDPASIQEQANTIIGRLKDGGITSVILATDPISPGDFTRAATTQEYFPEWVLAGSALVDTNVFGATYDQQQWEHAFGISDGPARVDREVSGAYFLYDWFFGEPPKADELIGLIQPYPAVFYAILQGVGPNLTPETFRDTVFSADPTARGGLTVVSLSWGAKDVWPVDDMEPDFNGVDDVSTIWWDPNETGTDEIGGEAHGMYQFVDGGKRYLPGEFPEEESKAFDPEGAVSMYLDRPPSEVPPDYDPLPPE